MLVIPLETQEAYEVAMHSAGIRLGTLCDAAQAEEQRDETTQAGSVLTGCRATLLCERAWIKSSLAGSKAAARHAIGSMPANVVRLYAKASGAADGTEVTRRELQRCSVSITSSWVPHWCAPSSTRTTSTAKVQDWVASQSTNGMQSEPSPRRRWNAQSRTCRHTKLATC
jgi:hypothetical protein